MSSLFCLLDCCLRDQMLTYYFPTVFFFFFALTVVDFLGFALNFILTLNGFRVCNTLDD